jgi:hypothetical protein
LLTLALFSGLEPPFVEIRPEEITLGTVALVNLAVGVVRSGPKFRLVLKLRDVLITESSVYEVSFIIVYAYFCTNLDRTLSLAYQTSRKKTWRRLDRSLE